MVGWFVVLLGGWFVGSLFGWLVGWVEDRWGMGGTHLKKVVGQLLSEELIPLAQPLVHLQGKPMVGDFIWQKSY